MTCIHTNNQNGNMYDRVCVYILIFPSLPLVFKNFIKGQFLFREPFENHHPRITKWAFKKDVISHGNINYKRNRDHWLCLL